MKNNVMDLETFRRELTVLLSGVEVTPPKDPETASQPAATAPQIVRAPSADEYRRKFLLSRHGPDRPLAALVAREVELDAIPAALAKLSDSNGKKSGKNLIVHQLTKAVDTSFVSRERAKELKHDAVSFYGSFKSNDPIQSMLDAQLVAVHIAGMNCLGRAANTANPRAQEINLRYGLKAPIVWSHLAKLRNALGVRGGESISVGKVEVAAGGQAIVGKIEVAHRADESMKPTSASKDSESDE